MALSANVPGQWMRALERPFRRLERPLGAVGESEFYEEDGEFRLAVDLPGFERDDLTATWADDALYVVADRGDRTYYRRFEFPKAVDDDGIDAMFADGVLDVRLPVADEDAVRGTELSIDG